RERILLTGDLPSPADPPPRCRVHTPCPFRHDTRCHDEVPALREILPGHHVACHWAQEPPATPPTVAGNARRPVTAQG
ncbi:MAG: peptide/nickel transport system ATP-binding protein, partial [Actinomycetota bacterium]|nr:peptide/nickel transport system ATP-binding protein [Actinomycetota bacterium]